MKLLLKFNLVLLLVFAIGFATTGFVCNRLLQNNARAEIVENARIMMEAALAVRTYTATQIKPLLDTQMKHTSSCRPIRPGQLREHVLRAAPEKISRVFLQRSDTKPNQSGKSRHRLGSRHRRGISQVKRRHHRVGWRARHAQWQAALHGASDENRQSSVLDLPRHARRRAAHHARKIRQRQWLWVETQRHRHRTNRFGANAPTNSACQRCLPDFP